jgi:fumarylacetoacetase
MGSTWVPDVSPETPFSLANIPFGIINTSNDPAPHAAVAIGPHVLDLKVLATHDKFATLFPALKDKAAVLSEPTLNAFASLGRVVHREVRGTIQNLLSTETAHPDVLRDNDELRQKALLPQRDVKMHLPMRIGDYTDFYAGYHHAYAVGVMFRGPQNALQPNYTHLPVGYHGRASSIVVSGTPIRRPNGQILLDPAAEPKQPSTGPSRRLDIELELGCFIARPNEMGSPIKITDAEDHIFGYVLLNDWSARDVQTWEYVPLGPFNGKNFASTVSPWVVLADALEPFRTKGIENKTTLQKYLDEGREDAVFDIELEVDIQSEYWTCQLHETGHFVPNVPQHPKGTPQQSRGQVQNISCGHSRR